MDSNQDKPKTLKDYLHPINVSISEATKADGEALFIVQEHETGDTYELGEKIYEFIANSPIMEKMKLIINNLVQKTPPSEDEIIKAYTMLVNLEHNFGKVNAINVTVNNPVL